MPIYLKTEDEIELMRRANRLVARTIAEVSAWIRPGIDTLSLDRIAEEFIRDNGGEPTFKGVANPYGEPFPAAICTSVEDCIVHGVPSAEQTLREGDIITIDCGARLEGFCGDAAQTFAVGEVSAEKRLLMRATEEALYRAIETAVTGNRLGDIGHAIQSFCRSQGYSVFRELSGHGIGRGMHEAPDVRNCGFRHTGILLQEGLCLSIEPMATKGGRAILLNPENRWSVHTKDRSAAAHYEHTIVVRRGKAEILSVV